MGTYSDLLKKHFAFSKKEIKSILVTVLILGFIFSFRDWGIETFNLIIGLKNFISAILISALALLVHVSAQRMLALAKGYQIEYRMWIYGLLAALVICFVTRGYVPLVLPGGIMIYAIAGHRLGRFRYKMSSKDLGIISMAGPLASIGLGIILKILLLIDPGHVLLTKALAVTLLFAVFTILPIPNLDGLGVFYAGRSTWAAMFVGIVAGSVLLYFTTSIIFAIIAAVILGLLGMLAWYLITD